MASATGIPLRTIYRWQKLDKVSGKGVVHDMRLLLLKEAAAKLTTPKPKKRARAA